MGIGIAGALIGGFLADAIFDADPLDEIWDISSLTAIVGAVILLAIYRFVVDDRSSRRRGII